MLVPDMIAFRGKNLYTSQAVGKTWRGYKVGGNTVIEEPGQAMVTELAS